MPPTRHSNSLKVPKVLARHKRSRTETLPVDIIVISSDDEEETSSNIQLTKTRKPTRLPAAELARPAKSKCPKAQPPVPNRETSVVQVATLDNIHSGIFGDPKTWSFGMPEPNWMNPEVMYEEFVNHPTVMAQHNPRQREAKLARFREALNIMNPKTVNVRCNVFYCCIDSQSIVQAHPDSDDRTVRYTHVEYPIGSGKIWFTIRWWKGWEFNWAFDIVDVPTRKVYAPRFELKNLKIEAEHWMRLGDLAPLMSTEEEARMRPGEGSGEERFEVIGGSRMLFSRIHANGKKEVVADIFAPNNDPPIPEGPRLPLFNPFQS